MIKCEYSVIRCEYSVIRCVSRVTRCVSSMILLGSRVIWYEYSVIRCVASSATPHKGVYSAAAPHKRVQRQLTTCQVRWSAMALPPATPPT
eukprot:125576-Chlamydomonas_euryale.AAC.1